LPIRSISSSTMKPTSNNHATSSSHYTGCMHVLFNATGLSDDGSVRNFQEASRTRHLPRRMLAEGRSRPDL
jgi:hypothetical protein